ncbi:MAG TPA: MFS transporter [Thermoanaerobaculia bacterium]|nr:MFS transporter [Thermoanaerobaculia bacterium]
MTRLRDQLRRQPAAAWILYGGTFVNRFGSFVMPMLAIFLTRRGYSPSQAGFAIGCYGVGLVIASAAGGHLADRIGRRNTIVLSMFTSAVAMLALSQARSYSTIVILAVFAGATTELYRPASNALIGDIVPPEDRVIGFALYRFALNLGFAFGPATAGFLANRSFFLLFAADAATSVAYGIIAIFALPQGLRTYSKEERSGEAVRTAFADPRVVTFLAAAMLASTVDFQMGSTFALHVTREGFSAATYGALLAINGVMIILFELIITARVQRMDPRPVIAIGYLLNGIGFALTGLAHTVPALAATVVVWTSGEMLYSPMRGAFMTQLAPERYRGRYMGLLIMAWSLGMIFGPTLGTILFERHEAMLWSGCAVLGVVSAVLVMPKRRPSAM